MTGNESSSSKELGETAHTPAKLLLDQKRRWHQGEHVVVEEYCQRIPSLRNDVESLLDLIYGEVLLREQRGEQPKLEEYAERFPHVAEQLRLQFELDEAMRSQNPTIDHARTFGVEQPGMELGPYKLRERIGVGGMGVVWVAEQKSPIRRKVALKVIKPGMDSEQVLARFDAERQALAMMDHPNIARVLDASTTAQGRPYFVMELIQGAPITDYCDARQLRIDKRLALFCQACAAVQHAHQKGIIHRDVKPSNVLVTELDGKPIVKVIDFGLAKALHQPLSPHSIYTSIFQAIGTLTYMSPEQAGANAADIDTRCDIYGLGVLLYELLTGTTPFDKQELESVAVEEAFRVIREQPPTRPSTKASTLSKKGVEHLARRGTDAIALRRALRGDLDCIVMKSIDKDRNRRYQSASELANDVTRYLNHLPIIARPPKIGYRFGKLLRRNWQRISISLFVLTSLILLGGAGWLIYLQTDAARISRETERIHESVVPRIRDNLQNGNNVAAFADLRDAMEVMPDDEQLLVLRDQITVRGSIASTPPGAKVSFSPWRSHQWLEFSDSTPLSNIHLPQGPIRLRFEKLDYVSRESLAVITANSVVQVTLDELSQTPKGMLGISGQSAGFLLDKFEVTNSEYQEFVDGGGYANSTFWRLPVEIEGEALAWPDAVQKFVDATGAKGPANWRNGRFPQGKGNLPVTGISWFEAMAYAAFRGKTLPTVSNWMFAADLQSITYVLPLSNYRGLGTVPVGSSAGIGRFGIYDMAGNVKEWCLNPAAQRRRCLCGGAENEPDYTYNHVVTRPPSERSENIGFRCAQYINPPDADLYERPERVQPQHSLSRGDEWEILRRNFDYDRSLPLSEEIISQETEDDGLTHEVVELDTAYGGERFRLHLYIPDRIQPPAQTVIYFPGSSAERFLSFEDAKYLVDPRNVAAIARTGRVVCWPEYRGTFGRRNRNEDSRQLFFQRIIDLERAIDYLETRPEVDMKKLGYVGFSWGANYGCVAGAVESRIGALVLVAGGVTDVSPAVETTEYAYAPLVSAPVLMVNGLYDSVFLAETSQPALFELLGSEIKDHVKVERDHDIPPGDIAEQVDRWLSLQFGEIRQ